MRRPPGVRTRLWLVVLASAVVVLVVFAATFNLLFSERLSGDVGTSAQRRIAAEVGAVQVVGGQLVVSQTAPGLLPVDSQTWIFSHGRLLLAPRVPATLTLATRRLVRSRRTSLSVPAMHTRLYAAPVVDHGDRVGTIVVGVSTRVTELAGHLALYSSIAVSVIALVIVALVSRWMLKAALRPVAQMAQEARSWSEHAPQRRFGRGEPYDEVSELAATLDGMMDRVTASLRREQRLSAEISHELRTPLARMSAQASLSLSHKRSIAQYRTALESLLQDTQETAQVVDALLAAAQQENGLTHGQTEIGKLFRTLTTAHYPVGRDGAVRVESIEPPPLIVAVEPEVAERILRPLIENACRFARSRVLLSARRLPESIAVAVWDDGPGVNDGDATRIFEAGQVGRGGTDTTRHAGLGLSLAHRLARAAGGDITLDRDADGTSFVVSLPPA